MTRRAAAPGGAAANAPAGRIDVLDAWRSAAVVSMLVYHLLFDFYIFGVITPETMFSRGLNIFERFICVSFIFLSGVSSRMSRSNLRRGIITLVCALTVSAAGFAVGQPIWFGVLHFLAAAMIIYGLLGRYLEKIPAPLLAICCVIAFPLTRWWTDTSEAMVGFLFPLGFTARGFASADYFPIFPWLFLFLLGTSLGGFVIKRRERRPFSLRVPAALTWPGRRSLMIYMLHQPVFYGLCWGAFVLMKL